MLAKTVASMKPGCILIFMKQRLIRAGKDRHVRPAKLGGVERVTRGLLHVDVASNCGNRDDADFWVAQCHDDGYGVVGGGVGIDQERTRHAGKDNK